MAPPGNAKIANLSERSDTLEVFAKGSRQAVPFNLSTPLSSPGNAKIANLSERSDTLEVFAKGSRQAVPFNPFQPPFNLLSTFQVHRSVSGRAQAPLPTTHPAPPARNERAIASLFFD